MTNAKLMTGDGAKDADKVISSFGFRHSFVIRHSDFIIP
jgi:hypothetical protein